MTDQSAVTIARSGAVGIIEMAQPKTMNALSTAAFTAIDQALDDFEKPDAGIRVVLVRAQGKHFCTGADLAEAKVLRQDRAKIAGFIDLGHRVLRRLEESDLPVVVACRGLALAGGGELMMACDVAIVSTDFRFGDQHAQYGLIPGWGGSQRLPRLIGLRRSLNLFFSAEWIDANTALSWGLVNHVVEPENLDAFAMAYCEKLATRSRSGIAAMKRLARDGLDGTLKDGLATEAELVPSIMVGDDVSEGLSAFEERRDPHFQN